MAEGDRNGQEVTGLRHSLVKLVSEPFVYGGNVASLVPEPRNRLGEAVNVVALDAGRDWSNSVQGSIPTLHSTGRLKSTTRRCRVVGVGEIVAVGSGRIEVGRSLIDIRNYRWCLRCRGQ